MSASRGFTLIEVLVALAIVTIGMAAVLEALTSSAQATLYLRHKTFAEWVALNQVERVRLAGVMPHVGSSNGEVEYAKGKWRWQQKVIDTPIPGVKRIVVSTRPAKNKHAHEWYATVTGYMGQAIGPPNPLSPQWIPGPIAGVPAGGAAGGAAPPLTQPMALP
ncbi:MAG: type II secretion system minor pseudopilin GspI [Steroidobacteraceae bacterium]